MSKTVGKALVTTMALGMFVVVLDNTIMNVSISALVADLDTTVSGVQAAISLNALMMAAFVLMGGKLADIIGMKRTFVTGAVLYVCGSLLASFSNDILVFILGWCAIQGFGAAMMLPNINTIIRANVLGKARAQAYGMMAGMNALGTAVGPIVGGFLTTYVSWRWAFRLEVFILLFVLVMSRVIPKDVLGKIRPSLDKVGVAWQAGAMMLLVLGTLAISDYGLFIAKQPFMIGNYAFSPLGLSIVPVLWGLGVFSLMMFVRHEKRQDELKKDKLVDLSLFKITDFVRGVNIRFIHVALVAGTTFSVPLFLQVTYGLNAFQTGIVLMAMTLGLLTTALGGSKKGLKFFPKQKIEWGFLICIIGLLVMALYMYSGSSPWGLMPGIFVYGLGLGLVASQIVNLVLSSIKPEGIAEASGVNSTLETLGSSVGTAIVGTVLVVALTSGVVRLVNESTVLPSDVKSSVISEMSTSIEVVSNDVLLTEIPEGSVYEAEALNIYSEARQNAFMITIGFMAFVALLSYLLSKGLPEKMIAEVETV